MDIKKVIAIWNRFLLFVISYVQVWHAWKLSVSMGYTQYPMSLSASLGIMGAQLMAILNPALPPNITALNATIMPRHWASRYMLTQSNGSG